MSNDEKLAEVAEALAEGRDINLDQMESTGELTAKQVRALRALHVMHQIQVGEIALPGEAPVVGVMTTRFEEIRELAAREAFRTHICKDRLRERDVVVRRIDKSAFPSRGAMVRYVRDLQRLKQIDHPALARILEVEDCAGDVAGHVVRIVMERPSDVTIGDRIRAGKMFTSRQTARAARELGAALAHLESRGFAHHGISMNAIFYNSDAERFVAADYADPPPTKLLQPSAVCNLGNCIFTMLAGRPPGGADERAVSANAAVPPGVFRLIDRARGIEAPVIADCIQWDAEMAKLAAAGDSRAWFGGSTGILHAFSAPFHAIGKWMHR
ncbi:MAG: hypothetical protein HY286_13370 [Planctomycetes bacterium]|nr:hypothetical protein [Planctomycetota bacterium]